MSGDAQTAAPGAELPEDLVVRVVDAGGEPVLGATVIWQVVSGGGTITPASVGGGIPGESITDPGGFNTARWTLGDAPGQQSVSVSSLISSDVVTFTATAESP